MSIKHIFKMKYIYILLCGVLVIGAFVFGLAHMRKPAPSKPVAVLARPPALCAGCNVILISVDSLRADHVGAYGYVRDTSPTFDALSKKGALFLNYFTTSFLTPVTEMSVQTGFYPSASGVTNFDTVLPKNIPTITEQLKAKDYKTAAILASPEFVVNDALKESFSRGFDTYDQTPAKDAYTFSRTYPSIEMLQTTLNNLGQDKFFLWLAIGGVHWPYGDNAPHIYDNKNYSGLFKGKLLDWTEFQNVYRGLEYPNRIKLKDSDTTYIRDLYDNGVRTFDDFLGQVMTEISARGLMDNSIIVIESEHGEDLNEHGYFAHYDVLDTQTHTPLLILVPKLAPQQRITSLASAVDVSPTIMDLLGNAPATTMQGESVVPLLTGAEQDGMRKTVFIERNPLWEEAAKGLRTTLEQRGIPVVSGKYKDIAIRTPEWKYILRLSKNRLEQISWWQWISGIPVVIPEAELYHLTDDPLELRNVIDQFPTQAAELRGKLENWHANIILNAPKAIEHREIIQPYF